MAGEFQPQLTQPKDITSGVPVTASPVVAGLGLLANIGTGVVQELNAERKQERSNKALDIFLGTAKEDVGGIPQDHPAVQAVVKADAAARQQGKRATTRRTATLNLGLKKLFTEGFTEQEAASVFRALGIKDPRLTALQEISNEEEAQRKIQENLIDTSVRAAGTPYMLNSEGKSLALEGGAYDREKSFAKLRQDQLAEEKAINNAKDNYTALVNEGLNPKNDTSLVSVIRGSLGLLSDSLTKEVNRETKNPANITAIQAQGRDIIANLREKQGALLAQIPNKDNRKDFKERTDALIAPYEAQFFTEPSDHATISRLGDFNKLVATLDKTNFRKKVPGIAIANNVSPELAKWLLETPKFQNLLAASNTELSNQLGDWIDFVVSVAPSLANTPTSNADKAKTVGKIGAVTKRVPERIIVTEEASIAAVNMLKEGVKMSRGFGITVAGIKAQDEAITNPIDGNLSGDAPSVLEINIRGALDPQATANYSLQDDQDVVSKVLALPRIANQLDLLESKAPGKGKTAGNAIESKISSVALRTAVELGKVSGFLESFLIGIDPSTQRFKFDTPLTLPTQSEKDKISEDKSKTEQLKQDLIKEKDGFKKRVIQARIDNIENKATARKRKKVVNVFGFFNERPGDEVKAIQIMNMLNEHVDVLMRYSKYDDRVNSLPEKELRKFYQDALLTVAATQSIGVDEDIVTFFPTDKAKEQAPIGRVNPVDSFGNPIDLSRPKIFNPDGTFSTERTITIEVDGKGVNIPTIVDGRERVQEEAIKLFKEGRNPSVGIFDTVEEADKAAVQRSKDIGNLREGKR